MPKSLAKASLTVSGIPSGGRVSVRCNAPSLIDFVGFQSSITVAQPKYTLRLSALRVLPQLAGAQKITVFMYFFRKADLVERPDLLDSLALVSSFGHLSALRRGTESL